MSLFSGKLVKKKDKLVFHKESDKKLYEKFIASLPEDSIVEFYSELESDGGSLAQLKKIHAMIRDLSIHTGHGFSEMKLYVMEESGLCFTKDSTLTCKSFADCSKEELSIVIQTLEQIEIKVNLQGEQK